MNSTIAFFIGFIIGRVGFLLIRNIFEKRQITKMIEAIEKAEEKKQRHLLCRNEMPHGTRVIATGSRKTRGKRILSFLSIEIFTKVPII